MPTKTSVKKILKEIEIVLHQFEKRTSALHPEAYIGGGQSKLRFIGLRVPQLQKAMQTGFSFSNLAPRDQAPIWNSIWQKSDCFEVLSLALTWFYDPKQKELLAEFWPELSLWSTRIDNWAHSDTLSGIYARIHEENPKLILPTLKKWNQAKNPWLRRLSIVSLLYYRSQRKKLPSAQLIQKMVEPQFDYDEYYVQKGVGWTLREAWNAYPKETFLFIKKNVVQISPVAFSAAIEKMPVQKKTQLKQLRFNHRKVRHKKS